MSSVSTRRPQLFGTDGIRGTFGSYPLDEATVRRLGRVLAEELASRPESAGEPPTVIAGGDTRDSTPVLGRWLAEGLAAGGARLTWLGVVPTPAVARLAARGAAGGIAVSASHNPHPDNGIKLLDAAGFKWTPEAEARLEARLFAALEEPDDGIVPRLDLEVDRPSVDAYLGALRSGLPDDRPLDGLAIAVDAGNGAASPFVAELFTSLGAAVVLAHAGPDGTNINAGCGSTHPEVIAALTRENACDLGLSFDGDADRVILADENGEIRDGDAILYLWARDLDLRGRLPGRRLVATSMSNLGLEVALRRHGIGLVRCDVGDREVVAAMQRDGLDLGGEQSGHIVRLSLSTTGDGLLTALRTAHLRACAGRPLSEMLDGFERFPQLLRNVRVRSKPDLDRLPRVHAVAESVERRLGDLGRLVLRYSGTEPLARIMIEGPDRTEIEAMAEELAAVIATEIGDEIGDPGAG